MESNWRWIMVTAVAPLAWGSTYFVTRHFLPVDYPLWGAALRAIPAALLLAPFVRRLPRGAWWWRSPVLGLLNFGAFFPLVYLAAQLLPSSIAASIMALAPFALSLLARPLLGQRMTAVFLLSAVGGLVGVLLVVGFSAGSVNGWGILASVSALAASATGSVLSTRWSTGVPILASTCWQLCAAGLVLLAAAVVVEGPPPALTPARTIAYLYIAAIAGALAFVCWFSGLRRLPAGAVGLIGLLNPVAGIALGVALAGETLGGWQLAGAALVLAAIALGTRRPSTPSTPPLPNPSPTCTDQDERHGSGRTPESVLNRAHFGAPADFGPDRRNPS